MQIFSFGCAKGNDVDFSSRAASPRAIFSPRAGMALNSSFSIFKNSSTKCSDLSTLKASEDFGFFDIHNQSDEEEDPCYQLTQKQKFELSKKSQNESSKTRKFTIDDDNTTSDVSGRSPSISSQFSMEEMLKSWNWSYKDEECNRNSSIKLPRKNKTDHKTNPKSSLNNDRKNSRLSMEELFKPWTWVHKEDDNNNPLPNRDYKNEDINKQQKQDKACFERTRTTSTISQMTASSNNSSNADFQRYKDQREKINIKIMKCRNKSILTFDKKQPAQEQYLDKTATIENSSSQATNISGYLATQGRIFRKWQTRYFVLNAGCLSVHSMESPSVLNEGEGQIGETVNLQGYHITALRNKLYIYISKSEINIDADDDDDSIMLIRATHEEEYLLWEAAFKEHINYHEK